MLRSYQTFDCLGTFDFIFDLYDQSITATFGRLGVRTRAHVCVYMSNLVCKTVFSETTFLSCQNLL